MDTISELPWQTQVAENANVMVRVTAADLTESTADTAQVLKLFDAPAHTLVDLVRTDVKTPLKDASDAAFNSNTALVGDVDDPDRLLTATQLNANGATVRKAPGLSHVYAAKTAVNLTLNSMAAKKLADLDEGELIFWFRVN